MPPPPPPRVIVFENLVTADGVLGKVVHLWEAGLVGGKWLLEGVC